MRRAGDPRGFPLHPERLLLPQQGGPRQVVVLRPGHAVAEGARVRVLRLQQADRFRGCRRAQGHVRHGDHRPAVHHPRGLGEVHGDGQVAAEARRARDGKHHSGERAVHEGAARGGAAGVHAVHSHAGVSVLPVRVVRVETPQAQEPGDTRLRLTGLPDGGDVCDVA